MYDTRVNPNMVILARESRGHTQSSLANEMGVTQGKISKIEQGLLGVSDEMLDKLAITLNYPKGFFFEQADIYTGISYHRKRENIPQKILAKIDADTNIMRLHLKKFTHSVEFIDESLPKLLVEEYTSATNIAKAIRQKLKIPKGPIQNLTKIIEDAGVVIAHCDFGTHLFDGLTLQVPNTPTMIFLNKNIPGDRLRLTLAHEVGHAVMHSYWTPTMEDEAFKFAAELLMPEEEIKHSLSNLSIDKLARLKIHWKVAMQALLVRAKNLNKVTERQYSYLWMQMGKAGYRTKEPIEIVKEEPTLLKEVINFHLKELGYSVKELCHVLNYSVDEFNEIYLGKRNLLRIAR